MAKASRVMGKWSQAASVLLLAAALGGGTALAGAPDWWAQRGVLRPGSNPDDYALLNQGQLKNLAAAAFAEMQYTLPGGAGDTLTALILGWSTPGSGADDYPIINSGQLKNLAKPFYDRLSAVGYAGTPPGAGTYPWTSITSDDDSFAYVNIGDAKYLFSFDLATDTDKDGLPDWWEQSHGLNKNVATDAYGDADNDGLTNLQEYLLGTNPQSLTPSAAIYADLDLDGDGLTTTQEAALQTDPLKRDSDNDGYWDGADFAPHTTAIQLPPADPNDHTAPVVTLLTP